MSAKPSGLAVHNQPALLNNSEPAFFPLKSLPIEHQAITAIVYCEGNLTALDGKTANGLVRYSEKYRILSIIDSEKAGRDCGMALDGKNNGIPVTNALTRPPLHLAQMVIAAFPSLQAKLPTVA